MRTVKIDLSKDIKAIDVHIFADEHIGDPHTNMGYLKKRIEIVKNTPNAYAILNGDLMDNSTKTSVGDPYSQTHNPQDQMDMLVELFKPIKNKILCITQGNHEARTYKKEGIDIMKNVAGRLGLDSRYSPESILLFLRFGMTHRKRKSLHTFYVTHGSGGGRKEGAKAIRLADLASIADVDVYVVGHTHLPMIFKESFFRVSDSTSSLEKVNKLFVNSSANLEYGGYGETIGCKPACITKPIIHLVDDTREASATL